MRPSSSPRSGRLALGMALAVLLPWAAAAQDLADFESRTTLHRLDNGWTFIIVERPVAPVFSFATFVDVGSAQEVPGITGLAHMFEHMAFKGTPNVGTRDYEAEKVALEAMEAAYQGYEAARRARDADPERVAELLAAFRGKQEAAAEFVVANEFDEILARAGGVGINAFTNTDFTGYFYSLPANKIELFCYLESERFLEPVFREFYEERDVVQEERRLRTESQPIGRLLEQFQATAFVAHPYKQPVVGYMSDLQSITMTDARAFFEKYYVPSNLVTAVVGDVDVGALVPMIEAYFGRIPAGPAPEPLRTVEPPQIGEKQVVVEDPSQPVYIEGYHMAARDDPDQPVWDAIDDILSGGRTSRLYRSLVRDKKIAANAGSFSRLLGSKYPTLWIAWAFPSPESSNEEVRDAIREEIERMKVEDVTDEELERFKTRAKAELLRSLRSNSGLASSLAEYQTIFGDWRELFRFVGRIEAVTKADIRRVASATLVATNRTVGMIRTAAPAAQDAGAREADDA
ncbi:MAG: insulinase family protein [Acidobacteriota bacterium]|nr:insulinase family protein [Acidobacteriota bacterium]MDH3522416.1 insulinase family protein [Acidobacteriota bacterium]